MAKTKPSKPWALWAEDCVKGLPRRVKHGTVDLVTADAPYNQGMQYDNYNDKQPAAKYWAWTQSWLRAANQSLQPRGSMFLFFPDEWASEVDIFCRKELKLFRRNWIIWTFTFGQAAQKRFTRSHIHLFYFSKSKSECTFNADKIRVPSARQAVYNDSRANSKGKLPDDTWALLKADIEYRLPPDGDVWSQSRICGTYKERKDHSPNQIPLPIMERIVISASKPGDLVVDPFVGSGTSGLAAVKHGRRFIGFDVSKSCIAASDKRIAAGDDGDKSGGKQMKLFP